MEIIGRLTADAVVRTVSGDRKVVSFTMAINDSYVKDGKRNEQAVFVGCSYWRNTWLAEYSQKGALVQVYGHLGVNAYIAKTEKQ
jgi:single-strand DNA-binding protein